MKDKIRTFIATKVHPEQKLLDQLNEFKKQFKNERLNWVPAQNFHLTLRFLGETTHSQVLELDKKLELLSAQFKAFDIQILGTGSFGPKGNPRVIYSNIQFPDEMRILASEIEKVAVSIGFHEELKPFRPHLTLARIKNLNNRTQFLQAMNEMPQIKYQSVRVTEFILYQSILGTEGPVYKPLKTYQLQ